MFPVLLASLAVITVSLSGKLAVWRGAGRLVERNLHFLVSFSAGVLLVVAYNLSAELAERAGSLAAGLPWVALGAAVMLVAFRYVPHFHHHHDAGDHAHSRIDANRVLASDAIHNVGDGVVIAASFAASASLGVASTISIIAHEVLQETSEFFVLREAGLSERTALIRNFAVSLTVLVGALGAFFLLELFAAIEAPILGISAGSYLTVVFHDLIPHSISRANDRAHVVKHAVFFAAGVALMAALVALLPHAEF